MTFTFTRSNNKAVAAVQRLAADLADKIYELAHYLTTHCLHYVWEWTRWILERMRELCQRLSLAVGCKRSSLANSSEMREASSSATEDVLKAVQRAMQLTSILIHDDDLCGDNLLHAEELHDVLEEAVAKLMELQRKMNNEDGSKAEEEENDNGEDAPASKKMRLT